MRAVVLVLVVGLAIVGALLHPLSLVLGFLPFDSRGVLNFIDEAKLVIADILGWALVALLALMLMLVVKSRLAPQAAKGGRRPGGDLKSTRMAVGIIAYNEAGAISDLVRAFKEQDGVATVVVIDNNSTD